MFSTLIHFLGLMFNAGEQSLLRSKSCDFNRTRYWHFSIYLLQIIWIKPYYNTFRASRKSTVNRFEISYKGKELCSTPSLWTVKSLNARYYRNSRITFRFKFIKMKNEFTCKKIVLTLTPDQWRRDVTVPSTPWPWPGSRPRSAFHRKWTDRKSSIRRSGQRWKIVFIINFRETLYNSMTRAID